MAAGPCFPSQIKDPKFTPDEILMIWSYAREHYIDKGVHSLDDTIHGVASDLGLKPEWVARAFTEPKSIRKIANDVYRAMSARRQAVADAKALIRGWDTPLYKRAINTILNAPFAVAVYGHGTVGMITHAGGRMFLPTEWGSYWRNFGRQWKLWASDAYHERMMQQLVRDPDYTMWKRAGAAIDPYRVYTDYGMYAKWAGPLGRAGAKGFDALKLYRLEANKADWAKVPASIKEDPQAAAETAKNIARMNNHATGAIDPGDGKIYQTAQGLGRLAFAAKLEGSRWARTLGDPLKTIDTFANWKNASAADRQIAWIRLRHAGEFAATYTAALMANQGLLKALGSNQNVNLTDPTKRDWLKFKGAGYTVALDGGLLDPLRLMGRVIYGDLIKQRTKYQQRDTRFTQAGKDVMDYARGKLAPLPGMVADLVTQADPIGRSMWYSSDKPKFKDQQPYTLPEYVLSKGPIPLSGAIREVYDTMRARGMPARNVLDLIHGLAAQGAEDWAREAAILASETTGAKVTKDYYATHARAR